MEAPSAPITAGKNCYVLLGATGDNALRHAGVWQGLYEAFAGGVFSTDNMDLHAVMSWEWEELKAEIHKTLDPVQASNAEIKGWQCMQEDGDCSVEKMLQGVHAHVFQGHDSDAQARNMTDSLTGCERIIEFMSIPPFAYGDWATASVAYWDGGKNRLHIATEKPFGTSQEDAEALRASILDSGLAEENLHLVDHFLSFFMLKHLPTFTTIAAECLDIEWSDKAISKILITEYERHGLEGRGGFFDGVGQVRDVVQSHALQILGLLLIEPNASRSEAKLEVFNDMSVTACELGQYEGFLLEDKLGYHNESADSTYAKVHLISGDEKWDDVEIIIATGKKMGAEDRRIEVFQRDGPGVLTFNIGKEVTGLGNVEVRDWDLKCDQPFMVPAPGFVAGAELSMQPGSGSILNYSDPDLYFPSPYGVMSEGLLTGDYGTGFLTYAETKSNWDIVTASSPQTCLDPPPQNVRVYDEPETCGQVGPHLCWKNSTVKELYDVTFACSEEHDGTHNDTSLYQAKCHP